MIKYKLIRSNRKTMALEITPVGEVIVRVPHRLPEKEITRFIQAKTSWIERHLQSVEENAILRANFTLNYGDLILFQGREIPILSRECDQIGYDGSAFYLPPKLTPPEIKPAVIQLYRQLAQDIITAKVHGYSQQIGLLATAIKITNAKTRWGSCNIKGNLSFSWRLIMADDTAIDYVVVHELAHLKEHNHSDNFWAIVASIFPDFKKRQAKLKELELRLRQEDWN